MKTVKKKRVACAGCGRKVWRTFARGDASCDDCSNAYKAQWKRDHVQQVADGARDYRRRNRAKVNAQEQAWRKANPFKTRMREKKYRARRALLALAVDMAAECSCGVSHTEKSRLSILGRMLPASTHEIREAWSCIWGLPFEDKSAGARRLYRDLQKLGAISKSGTFYLNEKRAA